MGAAIWQNHLSHFFGFIAIFVFHRVFSNKDGPSRFFPALGFRRYIYIISHVKGITKPLPPHFWCLDPFFCLPGDWPLTFINCGKNHLVQPRLEVREPRNSHKNHTKPPDFIVNIDVLLSWFWVPFSLHRPFREFSILPKARWVPYWTLWKPLVKTAFGNCRKQKECSPKMGGLDWKGETSSPRSYLIHLSNRNSHEARWKDSKSTNASGQCFTWRITSLPLLGSWVPDASGETCWCGLATYAVPAAKA